MQQKLKKNVWRTKIKNQGGFFLIMGEIVKKDIFDDNDDEYRMKRRKSKMKIANEENPINQNSLHDWISSREVIFPNSINSDIDGYTSTSTNKNSLHDWINNRGIIFPNPINSNIDDYISTSINKNSFHDWINSREVTFPDTISQDIVDYISISINQVSLHGWISSREVIIFEEISSNSENCLFESINKVSFHDWINNREIIFFDPVNHSELINQKDAAIFAFQNDVEESILNHFRDTVFWYEDWKKKKKNATIEIKIKYLMWK